MSEAVASIIKQPRMQVTIFIDTLSSVIWYQKNIDSKWRYLHIFEQVWKSSSPMCVIINHVILHCSFHKASRQCKLLCRSLTNLRTYSSVQMNLLHIRTWCTAVATGHLYFIEPCTTITFIIQNKSAYTKCTLLRTC